MHLIRLIIRIFHDARSPECQIFSRENGDITFGDTAENVMFVRTCGRNRSVLK